METIGVSIVEKAGPQKVDCACAGAGTSPESMEDGTALQENPRQQPERRQDLVPGQTRYGTSDDHPQPVQSCAMQFHQAWVAKQPKPPTSQQKQRHLNELQTWFKLQQEASTVRLEVPPRDQDTPVAAQPQGNSSPTKSAHDASSKSSGSTSWADMTDSDDDIYGPRDLSGSSVLASWAEKVDATDALWSWVGYLGQPLTQDLKLRQQEAWRQQKQKVAA